MKVFLANPPWSHDDRYGVRAGSRWPFTLPFEQRGIRHYVPFPFSLAYASSFLKKNKHDACLIDAVAEGITEDEFLKKIEEHHPRIVVLETSTPSFYNDMDICQKIKERCGYVSLVICGPHVSVFPEEIMATYGFIDFVIIGEYECILGELATHIENDLDIQTVSGIGYREHGEVKINKPGPRVVDFDRLPWPDREDLPMDKYNDGFCGLPAPSVQMVAGRGCPYQCTFCLWPQVMYGAHTYRKRNVKDVVDEMEWLISTYAFKAVYFDDDTFNVDAQYVKNICNEIRSRRIEVPWAVMARADLMSEDLLEAMAESGLYAVKYGIESANREILKNCRKEMDLNKASRMIRYTRKLGIKVHLSFCVGLPGETKETIEESMAFYKQLKPESVQWSIAVPFPGTELYNRLRQKGLLVSECWTDYDGNYTAVVQTESLSASDIKTAWEHIQTLYAL